MKKLLVCSIIALGVSLSAPAINAASDQNSAQPSAKSKKKIELVIVSCDGPHIGYFDDKKGKQRCVAFKNPLKKK